MQLPFRNLSFTFPPDGQQAVDQEIQEQLQELDSFLEKQTKQKSGLTNLQNEVTESCASTDELLQDISFRDILPLDEWRMSPRPPSVEEEEEKEKRYVTTQSSISNHTGSIVLNLKVSQVLLQQAASSLAHAESRMMGNTCSGVPPFDELDGKAGRRERQVVILQAVGPPSKRYIPSVEPQELEVFCSAAEESLKGSEVLNSL